uniref:General transcription factor 3C polypeptide 6 n=1 Tax=Lepisosteus oculatus TaxID=7918 RepID=W5NES9_LEPOC|nr:PREDICTED: general transcription factor 3C polypeptide 6 [Lepisosteus oculatus]
MDGDWEEEDQLVVVELSGVINSDFLTKCKGNCKIVGIDSEQPIIQVGRYVFAGKYEDALGSCVIFEEKNGQDTESEEKPQLKYKCHTAKKLMMQRTFLSEKKEGQESSGIEVLKLNDGDFSGRSSNLICSFTSTAKDQMEEKSETGGAERMGIPSSDSEVTDSENTEAFEHNQELGSTDLLTADCSAYKQTQDDADASDTQEL